MFKTIFKAMLYIAFIMFLITVTAILQYDIVNYVVDPNNNNIPLVLKATDYIMQIPFFGKVIFNLISFLR